MAFDFPSSPTTGQTYSVTGGPTYVYNGTAWVVLTPGNQFNRTVFTATAGQTTFTMNYVVGAIDVYRNGVKLAPADFTATNGTSIVLLNAATVGDTIEVISYPMITYSDAVMRTGDTMTGALVVQSNLSVGPSNSLADVLTVFNEATTGGNGGVNIANSYNNTTNIAGLKLLSTSATTGAIMAYTNAGSGIVERFRIDGAGRVTIPYQPAFSAGRAAGNQSAGQVIVYDQVYVNRGSHYNASTGVFTAPVSGAYLFYWYALNNQTSAATEVVLRVNGATYADARQWASSNNNNSLSSSMILNLSANDSVHAYIVTGTVYGFGTWYCRFGGHLLG